MRTILFGFALVFVMGTAHAADPPNDRYAEVCRATLTTPHAVSSQEREKDVQQCAWFLRTHNYPLPPSQDKSL